MLEHVDELLRVLVLHGLNALCILREENLDLVTLLLIQFQALQQELVVLLLLLASVLQGATIRFLRWWL